MKQGEQIWLAGIMGTLLFSFILSLAPLLDIAPIRLALWTGGFVTLNLTVASLLGYILEFFIGVGLAWVYDRFWPRSFRQVARSGMAFGALSWLFMMIIGLPLFDAVSPVVQHGYVLGPGAFLWRLGFMAPVLWLVASLAYGLTVSYLLSLRFPSFNP
jgi:hypothetical protein